MRDLDPPCVTDGSEHPASVVIELGLVPTNPPHLGTDRCPKALCCTLGDATVDEHQLEALRRSPPSGLVEHRSGRLVVMGGRGHDRGSYR